MISEKMHPEIQEYCDVHDTCGTAGLQSREFLVTDLTINKDGDVEGTVKIDINETREPFVSL